MRRMFTEKQVKELAQQKAEELGLQNENQVKGLIQADKDILSQIVYDTDSDTILFPKGVLPLRIYDEDDGMDYFFDYKNEILIDENGQVVEDVTISVTDDNKILIDGVIYAISDIDFISFDVAHGGLNTYYLYKLVSEGANFGGAITAPSIIEDMEGYSYDSLTKENITITNLYAGAVKNGNKLTCVIFGKLLRTGSVTNNFISPGIFTIPSAVLNKLVATPLGNQQNAVYSAQIKCFSLPDTYKDCPIIVNKTSTGLQSFIYGVNSLVQDVEYQFRIEMTFLLSENLAL